MTNEFSGHIAHYFCRTAALEHENHMNNYALRVLPCSATKSTHSAHPKTHPSWVYHTVAHSIASGKQRSQREKHPKLASIAKCQQSPHSVNFALTECHNLIKAGVSYLGNP